LGGEQKSVEGRGLGKHTVKWSFRASNLISPDIRILSLPDTIETIERRMMEVEDRVAGAGEGIILQTTDGKVAGGVEEWLRLCAVDFPSVGAFFEAVHVRAAEEVLHILDAELVAPEEVDVAGKAARIVFEGFVDGACSAVARDLFSGGAGVDADVGHIAGEVGFWGGGSEDRVHAEVNLEGYMLGEREKEGGRERRVGQAAYQLHTFRSVNGPFVTHPPPVPGGRVMSSPKAVTKVPPWGVVSPLLPMEVALPSNTGDRRGSSGERVQSQYGVGPL
jgi:hypothetical protein